jgi:hypothetical protein
MRRTGDYDAEPTIRCIEKGCEGLIVPTLNDEIYWVCVKCKTKGIISDWLGTRWDNGYKNSYFIPQSIMMILELYLQIELLQKL